MWDSTRQWEALCTRCNERLWAAAPGFSSWVCLIYPDEAVCDGLCQMPSFLAFDMRESCSHDYKQRGRSRCYSSCRSWHESNDESPALFGCCMLVSAFGGCRAGMPSAAEGSAPPEQCVRGEPTSLVNGQWRRQKENKKAWDTLLWVAEKWQEFCKTDTQWCGDVPFMMKWLNVSR